MLSNKKKRKFSSSDTENSPPNKVQKVSHSKTYSKGSFISASDDNEILISKKDLLNILKHSKREGSKLKLNKNLVSLLDQAVQVSKSADDRNDSTKIPEIINKEQIWNYLTSSLHISKDPSVMIDIVFCKKKNEFTCLGRAKLSGSNNQLNHVIPVAFVNNIIKSILDQSPKSEKNSTKFKSNLSEAIDVMRYLSKQLVIFSQIQKGFAISDCELKTEPYKEISKKSDSCYNRKIKIKGEEVMLFSPGKEKILFDSPGKKGVATKNYSKANMQFVQKAMEILIEKMVAANSDENAATIVCEAIARLIFIVFNQGENVSFSNIGAGLPYEIRLYSKKEDVFKKGLKHYKVVTSRELEEMGLEGKSGLIRVVNCEGSRVKKISAALKTLNDIIFENVTLKNIDEKENKKLFIAYNKNNTILKLANSEEDIHDYNDNLTISNYSDIIHNHIAKQLYLAFDLKALEGRVFVESNADEAIEVYPSASGRKITKRYYFKDGDEYRAENIAVELKKDSAKKIDPKFLRSKEKDLEILPKKLVELFVIGIMSFDVFQYFEKEGEIFFWDKSIKKLIELAAFDYMLDKESAVVFENKSMEIYNSWIGSFDEVKHDIEISFAGGIESEDFF